MHIIRLRCVKRLRKFHINIEYTTQVELTPRTLATAEAFGLGVDEEKKFVVCNCDIDVNAGEIVYITGDSGSGKSSILREFQKAFADECVNINDLVIDTEKPLVDTVGASVEEALKLLSFVGLNDAFLFLRKFGELSDGQKYRYKIAKLLESKKRVWILDEFTSTLDRDTAKIVAWNLQKFARLSGVTVLCATCMTDLGDDLAPNVRVDKRYNSEIKVTYNADAKARGCSLVTEMVVEQGTKDDWKALAEFHYRSHNVMIPLKIMRLVRWTPEMHERCKTEKQCPNNTQCSACGLRRLYHELVGVLVFSVPPLSIYGRKQYFGKCFNRSREEMQELNANFTLISRVVIHPKYRSMNLGVMLVRESLKQAPKRYVETIAVMAKYNPFFERAGMLKVCDRKIDKYTQETLTALNAYGFEATFMTSHSYNLNKLNNLSAEQQLNVKRALVRTCRGPTFNDYMKQRNLDRKAPDFSERLCAQDNEFIAHLIYRVALMATPKVYLVWDKAWLEHPELRVLPSDFQTTAPSTGLHQNVKNYGAS
jgi:ABC-type transport system involved in cytochrome c biogenesis ATPase subunit/GNAT superfamily N-acetyltransferase